MKTTKSKGDLNAQLGRIRTIFCKHPRKYENETLNRMVGANEIWERYHDNINNYLGDYDVQNDEAEFYRRYALQIPREIYMK